jgi:DNA-binding GntR family transcriptional regulator
MYACNDLDVSATSPKPSATQRVYQWVRARILDGTFAGGRLLSEGDVSDAVGVSRTPVREAFLQLAAENMLQLYPKRGALVVPVTASELGEVLDARLLVEPWAARALAAQDGRETTIAALRALVTEAEDALAEGDQPRFQDADRRFHQTLVAAAGNALLASFYASLRDRQLRAGMLAVRGAHDRATAITHQHAAIADELERGDGEAAGTLLAEHLDGTARLLGLAPPR